MTQVAKACLDKVVTDIQYCMHRSISFFVVPIQHTSSQKTVELAAAKVNLENELSALPDTLKISESVTLDLIYCSGKSRKVKNPTIIFFNANSAYYESYGLKSGCLSLFKQLLQRDYNLLFFNYRGIGESSGIISKSGMIEDGRQIVEYIKRKGVVD